MPTLSSREIALYAAHIAWEKDGQDLRVLEFPAQSGICDYCILVTGRSDRQVGAIADEVWQFAKKHGISHHPVEGASGWMVVDLLDVVVHAFGPEQRSLYDLDTLWPQAKIIDHEAALKTLPKLADA